jgi:hypothetical protein
MHHLAIAVRIARIVEDQQRRWDGQQQPQGNLRLAEAL